MVRRQKGRGNQLPKAQSIRTWVSSWSNGEPQKLSRGCAISEMCPRKLPTDWTGGTMEAGRLGGGGDWTESPAQPGSRERGQTTLPNREGRAG